MLTKQDSSTTDVHFYDDNLISINNETNLALVDPGIFLFKAMNGTLYKMDFEGDLITQEFSFNELSNQTDLPISLKDASWNILVLALPITGTMFITITTGYITGIFLANISTELFASMAIIDALETLLTMSCQSTLNPISPLVGRYSKTSPEIVGKILQQGYLISLIESVPSLLLRYFSKPILLALALPPPLIMHAEGYFRASMWGLPAAILVYADEQLLLASNKKKLYVIMSLTDLVVTLGVGYVLINGKFGFSPLGAASLGYASAIRSWVSFISYKIYFLANEDFKSYGLFNISLKNIFSELSVFLRIALPVTLQVSSKMGYMFAVTMMMGSFGTPTLASLQIVTRYIVIAIQPLHALGMATSIQIGIAFGQNKLQSIRRYGNVGIGMGLMHTGLLFAITATIPNLLARPFIDINDHNNDQIIEMLRPFFMILMGGQILEALETISAGALRGLMDTAAPMVIGMGSNWLISFPLVFIMLKNYSVLPTLGCSMAGLAVSSGLDLWRWHSQSAQNELEQSINHANENPEPNKPSSLLACLSFFKKPNGYSTVVTGRQIRNSLSDSSELRVEEVEDDTLNLSDDQTSRCGCTLF
jgi:MATE family multidrug resistance protein